MEWPQEVSICEVGPRDGLQNEKKLLSVQEKVALIEACAESGIKIIEIGSFVSPRAVPTMANTDEVAKYLKRRPGVEYRALAANRHGLERALECGITKVKLTVSASATHCRKNLNKTPQEIIDGFLGCVEFAKAHGINYPGQSLRLLAARLKGRCLSAA